MAEVPLQAVIFDWGGTLTPWRTIDFEEEARALAAAALDGDACPNCTDGILESARGIEMGHIFQLGRKYADALDLQVLDENGKLVTVTMGSYGIGVSRAVAAIVEATHDGLGLCWPREVSSTAMPAAVSKTDASFPVATRCTSAGATSRGQTRPRSSWVFSAMAATARDTPMP